MKKLLLPVGVLLIAFFCCPYSPVAQYLITDEPKVEDIVGVYKLSALKVVDKNIEDNPESRIEILTNGNCNMIDFPVFVENDLYGFTFKFEELFTGECKWLIETIGSVRRDGKTLPFWGICFDAINFEAARKCADLANDGNPYNLVFVFGDPDSNNIMAFEKPSSE